MFKDTILINKILKSKKETSDLIEDLNIYFYDNIGEEGCFEKTVTFKFKKKDLYRHTMHISQFLVQMMIWEPIAESGLKLDKTFILSNYDKVTNDDLADYYNKIIIGKFIDNPEYGIMDINVMIAEAQERLKRLAEDFSMILGLSVSIRNLVDLCNENEDIEDLMVNYKPLKNATINEIETEYNLKGDELIGHMKMADSVFKPLLNAKEGIKTKQFQQFVHCVGFQSNIDGYTFPTPIESSYVNHGLQSATEHFLDATMGNKAQIYQKVFTGNSGYFSRRSAHSSIDTMLASEDDSDCKVNANNLIEVNMKSKDHVKIYDGLYYKEARNSLVYRMINCNDKKLVQKLVGKVVYVRSPFVCANKEGVCHKCYGRLSRVNHGRHIGIHSSEVISSRLMQSILSTKHLLFTDSTDIKFNTDKYKKLFTIDANAIVYDPSEQVKVKGKNALYIRYDEKDLYVTDNDDEEDGVSYVKTISKFSIVTASGEEMFTVEESNGLELYLSDVADKHSERRVMDDDEAIDDEEEENFMYLIPLSTLTAGDVLFYIEIMSKEIKKPLKDITSVLDKKGHLGYITINEICDRLADLFIDSKLGFKCSMVHLHTTMYCMLRSSENIYIRPDLSKPITAEDYDILTIKDSIYNNGSILITLSFERIGQLLKKPSLYYRAVKKSFIDPMFYEKFYEEDGREYDYKYEKTL